MTEENSTKITQTTYLKKETLDKKYWHFPYFTNWDDVMGYVSDDEEFEIRCNLYETALDFVSQNPYASFIAFFAVSLTRQILSINEMSPFCKKLIERTSISAEMEFNRFLKNKINNKKVLEEKTDKNIPF